MNQDQVKDRLLRISETDEYFTVIFSGKSSRKVNGLYKPEPREIILHNRNFTDDSVLMYTAIHEYAHHIQFTTSPTPISTRSHTVQFWSLFHTLLSEAEKLGYYSNPFEAIEAFVELTGRIRNNFLSVNGALMKELGKLLREAQALCQEHQASFTDYLDRVLTLPRTSAAKIIKVYDMDLDPRIGFENMKTLTRINDPVVREHAQKAFLGGASPDLVKMRYAAPPPVLDSLDQLVAEKKRLTKYVNRLQARIEELNHRIGERQEK